MRSNTPKLHWQGGKCRIKIKDVSMVYRQMGLEMGRASPEEFCKLYNTEMYGNQLGCTFIKEHADC